jgi:hypothetical protein
LQTEFRITAFSAADRAAAAQPAVSRNSDNSFCLRPS